MDSVPTILRPGHITKEEIEAVLGKEVRVVDSTKKIAGSVCSPGMKYRHYAPKAPVKLFFAQLDLVQHLATAPHCKRILLAPLGIKQIEDCIYIPLSPKNLYSALREADLQAVDEVLVFCDEVIRKDAALMNRVLKAAE